MKIGNNEGMRMIENVVKNIEGKKKERRKKYW